MKLYNNRPSPYGRKVLIAAHEKSLMKRITLFQIDPWSDPSALLAVTPIGKVPALVTDDGAVITDSTIISEYFDAVGHGRALIGDDRFEVMARVALMQGLIDAAFAIVIERRRPTERRWDDWVSRQHRAIARTLDNRRPGGRSVRSRRYRARVCACLSRFPLAGDCVAVRAPDTRRMARRGRPPAVDAGDGALKSPSAMLTPAFARRRGMDGEGVDAVLELADKRRVDHAVALEPALAAKRFRDDIDPEMRLTARPVPCMPCMLVGLVHHFDALGRERRSQLFRDDVARGHGGAHSARDGWRSTVGLREKRVNVLVKT